MTLAYWLAVYFVTWWITLFAILPFGVTSQHETEGDRVEGTDPGAPVKPRLLIKAFATTIVASIVFAGIYAYVAYS